MLKESVQQYKFTDYSKSKTKNYDYTEPRKDFSSSMVMPSTYENVSRVEKKTLNTSSSYKQLNFNTRPENDPFKSRKVKISDFILGKNLG